MKIDNYGSSKRGEWVAERLRLLDESGCAPKGLERIILLPIPTTRDGVHITGTDKLISDVLLDVECGDFVVGYGIPYEDIEIISAAGGRCFDASKDECFLSENARLTALGTVGYILTSFQKAPERMTFGVVGYGRIGSRLVEMLLYFGAGVRVYTTKNATRVALGECGIDTSLIRAEACGIDEPCDVDVLINTAPTPLYNTFRNGRIPDGITVIELASGNNFGSTEGITRLMSLPDRMYPESAAKAFYEAIMRAISEVPA